MRTLLKNVWLLDNFYCVEPANILIEEERIASVLRDEQAADHIVDLSGCTVIPGLVDTDLSCADADRLRARLKNCFSSGVTTVRCNQMIPAEATNLNVLYSYPVESYTDYLDRLTAGKLVAQGINLTAQLIKHTEEKLLYDICCRSAQNGMWVTATASTLEELKILVACGITELLDIPDFPIPNEVIIRMVAKGICMTLRADCSENLTPIQRDNLRIFHEFGGLIALGSGKGNTTVSGKQIISLMEIGLSLQDAVKCATLNGAIIVGTAHEDGSILAGKYANMLVVQGNPFETPDAFWGIRVIVQKGKLYQAD